MYIIGFKVPFFVLGRQQWFNHAAFSATPLKSGTKVSIFARENPSVLIEVETHGLAVRTQKRPLECDFVILEENA